MIRRILTDEIEAHAARFLSGTLMERTAHGRLTPQVIARYLISLRYLLEFSAPFLARARDLARSSGRHSLAEFFDAKLGEETGHEVWAINDLVALQRRHFVAPTQAPVPAIVDLVREIDSWIEADPALYLAYAMWAEHFTVLTGTEFARLAIERCDIPADALTCLAKHVELDADHADDDLRVIAGLVSGPGIIEKLHAVVVRTTELFDLACDQFLAHTIEPATDATAFAARLG